MTSIYAKIAFLGKYTLFLGSSFRAFLKIYHRKKIFLKQCEFIGVTSTGIVLVAAIFLGGVLGYQLYATLRLFGAEAMLGGAVGVSLFRELAPVMAAIMVVGRAGAAMAAEISSQRISEQIDALEVMAVDPFEYLIAPRILAGILMLPLLGVFFGAMGCLAAAYVSCDIMGLSYSTFWGHFSRVMQSVDIIHCVVKSAVYGIILTSFGCFFGFYAHGGARGVGRATRLTVVSSCLAILFCDYLLTSFLPFGFTWLKI